MRVLLVDDDEATLDVLEFSLALEGHEVLRACDGQQGIDLARSRRPDLIILDMMMPIMDGLDSARALREDLATRDIPIVMLTARALEQDMWDGWAAGIDSYVTKPLDIDVLEAEIARVSTTTEVHL